MDNQQQEKLNALLAQIIFVFLLVAIIALPIWLFTIFGSIIFSILVFAVEIVVLLTIALGYIN